MTEKKSENNTPAKKPLTLKRSGKLELKQPVDTGQVRQSFSHGRTRQVAVEVKRKRGSKRISGTLDKANSPSKENLQETIVKHRLDKSDKDNKNQTTGDKKSRFVLRTLTDDEKAARARAVEDAVKAEKKARVNAEKIAEEEAEAAEVREKEQLLAERRSKEEIDRKKIEEEERKKAEEAAEVRLKEEAPARVKAKTKSIAEDIDDYDKNTSKRDDGRGSKKGKQQEPKRISSGKKNRAQSRRRSGRLTVTEALEDGDRTERGRSLAALKRQRERERREAETTLEPSKPIIREVTVPESITVQELSSRMAVRGAEVVKTLFNMGMPATVTQSVDADTAELIVTEFGHKIKRVSAADVEIGLKGNDDDPTKLLVRPPVVTVMGHVDHGKTSLLDALRSTDIVGGEAGGITQHIGAYQVTLESGDKITFIDTPGHAAFTQMRARGAKVTDIVILVVAADDGIMPQTVEAINHARAANVPIVVAINKIDSPNANADKVRNDMLQHELVTEELGGDILAVEVSAKEKTNLDKLAETLLLQSEILELKANPDRSAEGIVLEAKIDRGRGIVASLLVQRGTLHVGDIVVAGSQWGRIRAMIDDRGSNATQVTPATPVEILGLTGVPEAGDEFVVVENERRAREVTEFRTSQDRIARSGAAPLSIEQMFADAGETKLQEMPVVVKADVHGSSEAIVGALGGLSTEEVGVQVVHSGVGGITESDVTLAKASNAGIIGFNVRANSQAKDLAHREGIDIRYYAIIYDAVDDMRAKLEGMLTPDLREKFLGNALVLQVFNVGKTGRVAGCRVTDGLVKRGAKVRLLRDDIVIHNGALKTLRRFKEEVKEVKEGYECGMAFENYDDLRESDTLEFYELEEVARKLEK
ncbi:MAG: translation initiation factor IF-2 [Alphaproteobacteria bacterium]|nr:translation initiation factor IF-2 [Alphaproteobacteria bacterium]